MKANGVSRKHCSHAWATKHAARALGYSVVVPSAVHGERGVHGMPVLGLSQRRFRSTSGHGLDDFSRVSHV